MEYEQTQFGPPLLRLAVLAILVVAGAGSAAAGSAAGVTIVVAAAIIIGTTITVFSRFTVKVTDDRLVTHFGWGWPRRTLDWTDATAVRAVRNRWWYGFGIRWFPGGTLWNVWGLDAIEFDLVSGRAFRVGTDDPERLFDAVARHVPPG
jgi:hypothetical protein